jgi:hypothetical protein
VLEGEVMDFDQQIHIATVKAAKELETIGLADIQLATAFTWCGRALVSYGYACNPQMPHPEWWLSDAREYEHEALEHAALAGPEVYMAIHARIARARDAAARVTGL